MHVKPLSYYHMFVSNTILPKLTTNDIFAVGYKQRCIR